MTAKRKETCEEKLRSMCKNIANDITDSNVRRPSEGASEWMEDVYNVRYIVDSKKKYLGVMLMVAGNGPTIWVNTWTKEVEGSWGGDRCTHYFQDNIGLDDYNEEMYNCI